LGTPFQDDDLKKATDSIKHLLESNGFYEAQVAPAIEKDEKAQQVFITFRVTENKRAKYGDPHVEGAEGLSDSAILRITGWRLPIIHLWRHVTATRTQKGLQSLLAKYQSKDHLKATVKLNKLDYDAEHRRVKPEVKVDPGPEVKVKAVEAKVSR